MECFNKRKTNIYIPVRRHNTVWVERQKQVRGSVLNFGPKGCVQSIHSSVQLNFDRTPYDQKQEISGQTRFNSYITGMSLTYIYIYMYNSHVIEKSIENHGKFQMRCELISRLVKLRFVRGKRISYTYIFLFLCDVIKTRLVRRQTLQPPNRTSKS